MVNRVIDIKNTPYPYLTVGPVKKNLLLQVKQIIYKKEGMIFDSCFEW